MAVLEEAENAGVAVEIGRLETWQAENHPVARGDTAPGPGKVAPVAPQARATFGLRVLRLFGEKMPAPAAHGDFEAVAGRPFDQLAGDIETAIAVAAKAAVVFPVAACAFGIGAGRGGMRDPGGGDNARGQPGAFGKLEQCIGPIALCAGAIAEGCGLGHAERAHRGLDAGDHGGCRGRTVGDLSVMGIGLGKREMRQCLNRQDMALAIAPALLAGIYPRCGQRGHAHAITDENDHIARLLRPAQPGRPATASAAET